MRSPEAAARSPEGPRWPGDADGARHQAAVSDRRGQRKSRGGPVRVSRGLEDLPGGGWGLAGGAHPRGAREPEDGQRPPATARPVGALSRTCPLPLGASSRPAGLRGCGYRLRCLAWPHCVGLAPAAAAGSSPAPLGCRPRQQIAGPQALTLSLLLPLPGFWREERWGGHWGAVGSTWPRAGACRTWAVSEDTFKLQRPWATQLRPRGQRDHGPIGTEFSLSLIWCWGRG